MPIQQNARATEQPKLPTLDSLFAALVPSSGQAPTVQGELVRAISNLAYEYENNGNCNWSVSRRSFSDQLAFLQEHLLNSGAPSSQLPRAFGVLEEASRNRRFAEESSHEIYRAFTAVKRAVRQWCQDHPQLTPRSIEE